MSLPQRKLARGESVTFGGDPQLVDLAFPGAALPDVVGRIQVRETYWSITNDSRDLSLLVEDAGDAWGRTTIQPGEYAVPIPFPRARILILSAAGLHGFSVETDIDRRVVVGGRPASGPALLDPETKHFLVLVALCEPVLRHGSIALIPTTAQIAANLRRLPSCRGMTPTAAQYHLHYLVNHKLRKHLIDHQAISGIPARGRLQYRRAALVELALRFNLVRPADLRLLEPR